MPGPDRLQIRQKRYMEPLVLALHALAVRHGLDQRMLIQSEKRRYQNDASDVFLSRMSGAYGDSQPGGSS